MFLSDDDSKPSRSGKSTDEDVEDYVPEQDADVATNMPIDEADKL
jgi:midasin (ATPase involved in ribosome maturation)